MGVRCIRQFTELPAKDALLELTHGLLYPRKNEVYIVSICIIFVSTAFSNSQRVLLPFGFLIWDTSIAALAQVEIETDLRQSHNITRTLAIDIRIDSGRLSKVCAFYEK